MKVMYWSIQTSEQGVLPVIMSEYLLNDMGVFIKSELRMPKKGLLTAVTGFRIGYELVKGTDYRMAPYSRNALLWKKVTSVNTEIPGKIEIKGNKEDVIIVVYDLLNKAEIMQYIEEKRIQYPPVIEADSTAAAWICWRDDDEWEDRYMSLPDMVTSELQVKRFVEDVIEDTILDEGSIEKLIINRSFENLDSEVKQRELSQTTASQTEADRPKFCSQCGALLPSEGIFCSNCGHQTMPY